MNHAAKIVEIPLWSLYGRLISDFMLRLPFPRLIIDATNELKKAEASALAGRGLVIPFTHFSLRDAMEVNRSLVFTNPILKNRRAINPLSHHHYNRLMEFMASFYSGDFYPIVNSSTLSKKGFAHLPRGKGLSEFMTACITILTTGGVVPLAVNATRKETLDAHDRQRPVGYLIASMQAAGVDQYGFLLVGFAIKNATTYRKNEVGGMNYGKTCIINIARYYSLDELLGRPEVCGKASVVDTFIRSELSRVVPKEYL